MTVGVGVGIGVGVVIRYHVSEMKRISLLCRVMQTTVTETEAILFLAFNLSNRIDLT